MKAKRMPAVQGRMVAAALPILIASGLWAQAPATPTTTTEDDTDAVIRVNTELVGVDVVVTSSDGPVLDLTADDFEIYDNGKQQTIRSFSRSVDNKPTPARPLPLGAVANRLNSAGEEPASATVILWDILNTSTTDQSWVRQQVADYFDNFEPGEQVALYYLAKEIKILQNFTESPELMRAAVARLRPEQSVFLQVDTLLSIPGEATLLDGVVNDPLAAGVAAQTNAIIDSSLNDLRYYTYQDRAFLTVDALREISDHLGGMPGRKKFIWISGSFPALSRTDATGIRGVNLDYLNLNTDIDLAIKALNEANIAMYPVSPRGLTTTVNMANGGQVRMEDLSLAREAFASGDDVGLLNQGIDTMNLLARGTGGRTFYSTNGVTEAVAEVFAENQVSYSLTFTPSDANQDGSYHSLKVNVKRRGVDSRHRQGYYVSDRAVATEYSRTREMNVVMRRELDATDIGLIATALPTVEDPALYKLDLSINVNDLEWDQQGGRWIAVIGFATRFSETAGWGGTQEVLRVSLAQEKFQEAITEGWHLERTLDVDGQVGDLRVLIQDYATGKLGTVWVPLGEAQPKD